MKVEERDRGERGYKPRGGTLRSGRAQRKTAVTVRVPIMDGQSLGKGDSDHGVAGLPVGVPHVRGDRGLAEEGISPFPARREPGAAGKPLSRSTT